MENKTDNKTVNELSEALEMIGGLLTIGVMIIIAIECVSILITGDLSFVPRVNFDVDFEHVLNPFKDMFLFWGLPTGLSLSMLGVGTSSKNSKNEETLIVLSVLFLAVVLAAIAALGFIGLILVLYLIHFFFTIHWFVGIIGTLMILGPLFGGGGVAASSIVVVVFRK